MLPIVRQIESNEVMTYLMRLKIDHTTSADCCRWCLIQISSLENQTLFIAHLNDLPTHQTKLQRGKMDIRLTWKLRMYRFLDVNFQKSSKVRNTRYSIQASTLLGRYHSNTQQGDLFLAFPHLNQALLLGRKIECIQNGIRCESSPGPYYSRTAI